MGKHKKAEKARAAEAAKSDAKSNAKSNAKKTPSVKCDSSPTK